MGIFANSFLESAFSRPHTSRAGGFLEADVPPAPRIISCSLPEGQTSVKSWMTFSSICLRSGQAQRHSKGNCVDYQEKRPRRPERNRIAENRSGSPGTEQGTSFEHGSEEAAITVTSHHFPSLSFFLREFKIKNLQGRKFPAS